MFRLFFYIVFIFSCFNFEAVYAANQNEAKIISALSHEDEPKTLTLPEASDLPHPLHMRELMSDYKASWGGKFLALVRYFDMRYPADQIEADFTPDLLLIFPEADPKEIDNTASYLRFSIKLYRLTQEKITEFKQKTLVPKDPPLMANDDEYAILGDQPYIKAPDGQFALVSDFKKIIGYSHNIREKEAMDAFLERRYKTDEAQTDFEHFTSMLDQIEWDKILQYGVTLPSPFVGNAGIGKYTKQNDFKIRLLSEEARLGEQTEILAALHVIVPHHRFMLATTLNDEHLKPQIKLMNLENIKCYEVFYPLPLTAVSQQLIGAYRGDFAFPIKLILNDPTEPISFEAEIIFENCDAEPVCEHEQITASLNVGVDQSHRSIPSAVQNFVRQSYYNLPKPQNKNIQLKDITYTKQDDASFINFDFAYSAKIKNFSFILENDQNTTFADPEMVTSDGHIYLRVQTLQNGENVQNLPLTFSVRLNDYDTLRQTIVISTYQKQKEISSLIHLFILGIWVGCGFYFTFFGLPFLMELFLSRRDFNFLKRYTIAKVITSFSCILTLFFVSLYFADIFYFEATSYPIYISLMFFIWTSKYMALDLDVSKDYVKPAFYGCLNTLLVFLAFPLMPTIGSRLLVQNLQNAIPFSYIIGYTGLLIGILMPDLLYLMFSKKAISPKLRLLAYYLFKIFVLTDLVILFLWLLLPLTFLSALKILILIIIEAFILKVLFHFWQALYKADLPQSYISGTQNVIFFVLSVCIALMSKHLSTSGTSRIVQTQNISFSQIQERVNSGENILLGLYAPNCLKCIYNNITVFNEFTLDRLKQTYNVTYLPVVSQEASPDVQELFKKYKRYRRPLYVLFSPMTPNGVVLQELIFPSPLFSYLKSFHFASLSE